MGQSLSIFPPSTPPDVHQFIWSKGGKKSWSDKEKNKILAFYDRYGEQFHQFEFSCLPLLVHAIMHGNLDGVEFLMSKCNANGNDINIMFSAGRGGRLEMIKMLVEKEAEKCKSSPGDLIFNLHIGALRGMRLARRYGYPPCSEKMSSIERYLVSKRVELESSSEPMSSIERFSILSTGVAPESIASRNTKWTNDCRLLEKLCRGAYEFKEGETAHSLLTRLFQKHGRELHTNFTFFEGRSALSYAAFFGNENVVQILAEACCGKLHALDSNRFHVVREACIGSHSSLVHLLIEEHKCSLFYFWCPPADDLEFHRVHPEYDEPPSTDGVLGDREWRLNYLNKMFGDSNDSLKKYLMDAEESQCSPARRGDMSADELSAFETGARREFESIRKRHHPTLIHSM